MFSFPSDSSFSGAFTFSFSSLPLALSWPSFFQFQAHNFTSRTYCSGRVSILLSASRFPACRSLYSGPRFSILPFAPFRPRLFLPIQAHDTLPAALTVQVASQGLTSLLFQSAAFPPPVPAFYRSRARHHPSLATVSHQ